MPTDKCGLLPKRAYDSKAEQIRVCIFSLLYKIKKIKTSNKNLSPGARAAAVEPPRPG